MKAGRGLGLNVWHCMGWIGRSGAKVEGLEHGLRLSCMALYSIVREKGSAVKEEGLEGLCWEK